RILISRPDLDVLIVDDNSPDGTGEIADGLARGEPRVSVIHRERKGGLATAYLAGFRYALARQYEYIVQMDADFSHRVEDLGSLIAAAEAADVVIGSRSVVGGQAVARSPLRRLSHDWAACTPVHSWASRSGTARAGSSASAGGRCSVSTWAPCALAATPSRSKSTTCATEPACAWWRSRSSFRTGRPGAPR